METQLDKHCHAPNQLRSITCLGETQYLLFKLLKGTDVVYFLTFQIPFPVKPKTTNALMEI